MMSLRYHVKMKGHKFCGLMIKKEFAQLFLCDDPLERKIYEIRSQPIQFLAEGDKIGLIATGDSDRRLVAILQFMGNIKILKAAFPRYYNLHKVETKTFEMLSANWRDQTHCFGWHLELVMTFKTPIKISMVAGPEVWHYFTLESPTAPEARCA